MSYLHVIGVLLHPSTEYVCLRRRANLGEKLAVSLMFCVHTCYKTHLHTTQPFQVTLFMHSYFSNHTLILWKSVKWFIGRDDGASLPWYLKMQIWNFLLDEKNYNAFEYTFPWFNPLNLYERIWKLWKKNLFSHTVTFMHYLVPILWN